MRATRSTSPGRGPKARRLRTCAARARSVSIDGRGAEVSGSARSTRAAGTATGVGTIEAQAPNALAAARVAMNVAGDRWVIAKVEYGTSLCVDWASN